MDISNLTRKRIHDYLMEGKRFDNRKLLDFRDITIETDVSKNAEGSARVKFGKTEVIAGVKLGVGEPYTDSEESGVLITTVELLPLSSPKYEPGPPRIDAIEIARIVDRGIRESGFIDFNKLCIKEGEKVWIVFLDIFSINDDGNLIDAACLASVAALKTAKMPKYDEKTERVQFGEWTNKKLPLGENLPLTITFHKIGKSIFLDPVTEEEESSEARLSLAITKKGTTHMINALQKGHESPLSAEEIGKIIDNAIEKFSELHKIVEKSLK